MQKSQVGFPVQGGLSSNIIELASSAIIKIQGDIKNLDIGINSHLLLDGPTGLHGIHSQSTNRITILTNISNVDILIYNESQMASDHNRIKTGIDKDRVLGAGNSLILIYELNLRSWVIIGATGSSAGSNQFNEVVQLANLGATITLDTIFQESAKGIYEVLSQDDYSERAIIEVSPTKLDMNLTNATLYSNIQDNAGTINIYEDTGDGSIVIQNNSSLNPANLSIHRKI